MELTTFSTSDESDLVQYRQVSPLAIIGLILGLLSPAALAHPLLWLVPACGAIVCIAALVSISLREEEISGRQMATWGLVLALFFGSWSVGQVTLRGYVIRWQARQLADHWLQLWQAGEHEQAHQLVLPAAEREPEETNLKAVYANTERLQVALDVFRGDTPRGWLRRLHQNGGTFEYVATEHHVQEDTIEDVVSLLYDLRWEENGTPVAKRIKVVVRRRELDMIDLVDWQIREVDQPERTPL